MKVDDVDDEPLDLVPFNARAAEIGASLALTSTGWNRIRNEQKRALRDCVEAWALRRECIVDDGVIVGEADGVRVTIALYDVSEALAVVRAEARRPVDVSVVVEPRTLGNELRERFAKAFHIGDPAFDELWHIVSSDAEKARVVLDETCRVAIQELVAVAWCRTLYERGHIEIRLDAENLTGRHVTLATQLAVALGRRELSSSPYR
jgi:hypothetical protein